MIPRAIRPFWMFARFFVYGSIAQLVEQRTENPRVVGSIPTEIPYGIEVYHYFDKDGEEIAFEKYDESDLTRIEYNLRDETFG